MKLIVFLGNAGTEYAKNRHNLGFMIGDFYAKQNGAKWKLENKFGADIATIDGENKVLLVKPQFLYNRTGEVVSKIARFYKIDSQDILAICDDFTMDFGKIRLRKTGSAGGNNGLKSIIEHIGENFNRIRIGTDNELRDNIGETAFVLSDFSKDESKQLPEIIPKITEMIDDFIKK